MTNTILASWQCHAQTDMSAIVIPDGCRDLLFWYSPGSEPHWSITSLDKKAYTVSIKKGAFLRGFRLRPGTGIARGKLLASVKTLDGVSGNIGERINSFTSLKGRIRDALDCLSLPGQTITQASADLGISSRSLQRLMIKHTGRTPVGWLSLARIRNSARDTITSKNLAETAYNSGYSDQSHMTREFKRWLNVSPSKLRRQTDIINQLAQPGFC